MRLINVNTWELCEFSDSSVPAYAILSHTWGDDEVTYHDWPHVEARTRKAGFYKIYCATSQAKADGLAYAWVDTCCIDKSSSHELSEAINSMWSYYMNAAVCYVYLSDVPGNCPLLSDHSSHPVEMYWIGLFEESRWFKRGWTLQELIAPRQVLFFNQEWSGIGALSSLIQRVSGITGIQQDVLEHRQPISDLSVARRLSWAARRETTRIEDRSYSLFGILGVNMPLLYGEGSKAFLRLQEEIIKRSTDQSLFAWDAPSGPFETREQLLAPSPNCFANSGGIVRRLGTSSEAPFKLNNKGLEISLPIIRRQLSEDPSGPYVTLGILDCRYETSRSPLALVMKQHPLNVEDNTRGTEHYVSGYERGSNSTGGAAQYSRLFSVRNIDARERKADLITITHDLQSQPYMQAFRRNDPYSFPVWFMGNDPRSVRGLREIFPERCWASGSKTMRLDPRNNPCGGVVVDVEWGSLLIAFGLHHSAASNQPSIVTRIIYGLVFVDPACSIQRHVTHLTQRNPGGYITAVLRVSKDVRVVARLSNDALTVEIEMGDDERSTVSSPSVSSPPLSPISRKRSSFTAPARKDSFLDNRSDRSQSSNEINNSPQRIEQCERCRYATAREENDRKRAEERRLERKRSQKHRKLAQNAGMGLTLMNMLDFIG